MSYFDATFNGSGDLSGYTPETGSPFTAPTVDLDDSSLFYYDGQALTTVTLTGDGSALYDNASSPRLMLKAGGAISVADYVMALYFRADPASMTGSVALVGHATTMTGIGSWTNGVNNFGAYVEFAADGSVTVHTIEATRLGVTYAAFGMPRATGLTQFLLQVEFKGTTQSTFLNGVLVTTQFISDSEFGSPGSVYIAMNAVSDDGSASPNFALFLDRILVGPLGSGKFWTKYVLTTEIDG